jgi:glycine cleavage system H protein
MSYTYDPDARYTRSHTWVRLDGQLAVIGVSDYAQKHLSDVMWVELPAPGTVLAEGDVLSEVESIKASGEVYAPVAGEVVEVNAALASTPDLINRDPYGEAWLAKVRPADAADLEDLMDVQAYEAFVVEEEQTGGH